MKNVSRTKYITAHGVASCSRKRCGMHRCAVVKVKIDSFFFLFFFRIFATAGEPSCNYS